MSESQSTETPEPSRANSLRVGRAVLSAPRGCARLQLQRALSAVRGALGAARPTFWRHRAGALGLVAFFFLLSVFAQLSYEVTDFRYILGYHKPPYEKQMQAILEGARMQPLPDGRNLITDGKLHNYLETGEPQMNVLAPQAFLNQAAGIVTSPGHLRVETADGRFSLDGDGFQWQTNTVLFISNRVHTVVLPDLLNAKSGRARPSTPVTSLDVVSDHFHYTGDSSLAVYQDHVRVAGTNLLLTSGRLTLKVPQKERLETIRAEQNVVLDYTNAEEKVHATGGQALYTVPTDQLRVTDHPAWHTALRQGSGDELFIDRTNKIFRTTGQAWLSLVSAGKNGGGLLPSIDLLKTNAAPATNQVVEIRSDSYEFRTNFAVFNQHVHLVQHVGAQPKANTLDCGVLTVSVIDSNQVQRMVAEKEVLLQQEDKAFTGGKAVYTPTNGILELTENPTWRAGLRQGKGDHMFINVTNAELTVRGNASMRVPGREVTPPALGHAAGTNARPQAPVASPRGTSFADIFAEEYTMRRDGDRLVSHFRGGVYITHTQMNLVCASMTVNAPLEADRGETTLTADKDVQFDLLDARGQRHHGKGDKVVYTHSVSGRTTNDLVVLTGEPALLQTTIQTTNNAFARNNTFTIDLGRGTISGAGQYVFNATPGFNTNQLDFKWPTRK